MTSKLKRADRRLQARRALWEKSQTKQGTREPGSMNAHKSFSIKQKRR